MITDLPWEAISIIAANSGQADCVSLGIACPSLMPWLAPRLYRSIVIDLGPRPLCKNIEFEEIRGAGIHACTIVRTSAGLRRCLQVLGERPEWASKVWSLRAKSNLPLSDYTMRQLLTGAFVNLKNLVRLEWLACPELPPDVLNLLPNKSSLWELEADMALRAKQEFPEMEFENLQSLCVRPFLDSAGLAWLRRISHKSQLLRELTLCRFLDAKREVGSGYAFVGLSDSRTHHQDVRLISDFFEVNARQRLPLEKLELVQFCHDNDAALLIECTEMQRIHTLGLSGIDAPDSSCLLESLKHQTPALKSLRLDWNAPAQEVVKYLDHLEIETLEIAVYAEPLVILRAVGRQRKLKHLRISMHCRFLESDFEPVKKCEDLVSLAMPFSFQVQTWAVVHSLKRVEQLELEYAGEKNQQRIGGGNSTLVSCGLLSMWNDEYAYPLQYTGLIGELRLHNSLRVVEIDGHSHTLKPERQVV